MKKDKDEPVRLPVTPENDARQAHLIDLLAIPGWKEDLVQLITERQGWMGQMDDRDSTGATTALVNLARVMALTLQETHIFLTGYMLALGDAVLLPIQWLEKYAQSKGGLEKARQETAGRIVTPLGPVARRIDPIPGKKGDSQ